MSQPNNTERLVEQYVENLGSQPDGQMDRRIIQDSTRVMEETYQASTPPVRTGIRGTIGAHGARRVAAIVALAIVLVGAVGLRGAGVAFSDVGHAVSSTLDYLKESIMAIRTGERKVHAPLPPAASDQAREQTPDCDLRAVVCAARFFSIPRNEQALWQSLREQDIELIPASTDPETHYATLSSEQAERFEGALTTGPITSPRVTSLEGELVTMTTNVFALAWLPTISSDGERIKSTFSFHDGENGFEIPNISAEDGGVILVRVRGIAPTSEDLLILLKVGQTRGGRQ